MDARFELRSTPAGRRPAVSRVIPAPRSRVWELLVDTHQWPAWGPTVSAVRSSDRRIAEGTTGRVRTVGGIWLPFRVTACSEYRWTWRVAGLPATGHQVEAAAGGCRAGFDVPLLAAPYLVVCARALDSLARLATAEPG